MAKDKEKKLKSKNKKLKKKLENALRQIASLEGKDPDQFVSSFEQEETDSSTDKLLDALGLKSKQKKNLEENLRSLGYEIKKISNDSSVSTNIETLGIPANKIVIGPCPSNNTNNAATSSKYKGKVVYTGKNEEERREKMKEHVATVVDYYCSEEGVLSDISRKNLVDYIMRDTEESRDVFKYLRQYNGEIPPETLDNHEFKNEDGTPMRVADAEWLLMAESEKMKKIRDTRDKIKELIR